MDGKIASLKILNQALSGRKERVQRFRKGNPSKANFLTTTSHPIKTIICRTFPKMDPLLINSTNSSTRLSKSSATLGKIRHALLRMTAGRTSFVTLPNTCLNFRTRKSSKILAKPSLDIPIHPRAQRIRNAKRFVPLNGTRKKKKSRQLKGKRRRGKSRFSPNRFPDLHSEASRSDLIC